MRTDPESKPSLRTGAAHAALDPRDARPVFAAGLVVGLTDSDKGFWVAVSEVDGRLALPRVVLQPGETDLEGAQRAYRAQVGEPFPTQPIEPLATLETRMGSMRVVSSYWRWEAPNGLLAQPSRCQWLPWEAAIERLALPEEQSLLTSMNDPLAQPLGRAAPTSEQAPPKWVGPKGSSTLGAAVHSARFALETESAHADWRVRARGHLDRAERALQAGEEAAAQDALAAAWKLDFESRSVSERRLWTRLLQGEVRALTRGFHREALLAALEEIPEAGTLARIRLELDRRKHETASKTREHQKARGVQIALVAPPCLALALFGSNRWISGELPARETLLPAVLGLGLLGGFAWSALRQAPGHWLSACAPLLAGATSALLGFLAEQAGVLHLGHNSAAATLLLALAWGFAGAFVWGLKRPSAYGPPNE